MLPVEINVKIRFKIFLACLVFIRKNFFSELACKSRAERDGSQRKDKEKIV